MAYAKGGSDTNLIQGYAVGEDADIDYGKHRWLAQTFTITAEHVTWRFRVKSWTRAGDRFYHYAIRATDAAGKPTNTDLYHTTLSPTGEAFYAPGKWQRFDFDEFPILPAGTYAIVLSVPDSPGTWQYKARADETAPTYTGGKAWRSDDSGATWNEIATTDLMFEVWGWTPPPDPPPTPSISNVSTRKLESEIIVDGFTLVVYTDIKCHLFMRWTKQKPRIHDIPVLRRGIQMHGDRYFCFTAYHDNEQEEAGDTLTHTFIKHDWQHCETRYFYFWAEVQTEAQPSTSAIFKLHFDKEKAPLPPEIMFTFNSIEPQLRSAGTGELWKLVDLSHELPPGATGAIIQIQNTDLTQLRHCGLRKPGSVAEVMGALRNGNYTWGLVGCDENRIIEAFAPFLDVMIYWVMGYTGPNVHFLDNAHEFTLVRQVWNDLDCSPYVPADADAAIFNVSGISAPGSKYAIRQKGSTDVHYAFFHQNFPVLGLDENKMVEIWPIQVGSGNTRCFLTGYIVGGVQMHLNSIEVSPPILGSWQGRSISAYNATTHFAIIETAGAANPLPWGVRKGASLRPILGTITDHQWCFPHCTEGRLIDIYRSIDTMHFYEIGVTD